MALRNILTNDINFLHKKSKDITDFGDKLNEFLDDMVQTLHSRKDAVGLAAPQVGVLRRVAVIDVGDGVVELINPVIVNSVGEQISKEGCLSFPNIYKTVKRPNFVKVRSLNRAAEEVFFEGSGLFARALCHEIDHLSGIVFLDIAEVEEGEDDV